MTSKRPSGRAKRDRAASIEHHRRFCVHYDGMAAVRGLDSTCKAGVRYHDVGATMKERPCLDGHLGTERRPRCPKWERTSEETAAKESDESDAAFERVLVALKVASAWRVKPKPKQDRRETVECPICKGKLHLSQSSYNGHVHGTCETPKCVSWME